jgi:hypothetical protein
MTTLGPSGISACFPRLRRGEAQRVQLEELRTLIAKQTSENEHEFQYPPHISAQYSVPGFAHDAFSFMRACGLTNDFATRINTWIVDMKGRTDVWSLLEVDPGFWDSGLVLLRSVELALLPKNACQRRVDARP